ncbi:MAG: methylated-DNA--[protein]-cysteine S-methyltransferase [Gaiellaceae bacterium]
MQPYEVPGWGVGELWLQDGALVYHELPRAATSPAAGAGKASAVLELVQAYFAGEPITFDEIPVELDWCTPFQRAVAEALRRVPYGDTVTYGELAIVAGYPNAHRAAGTFCAGNRFPLVLPCHRVVSAGGIGPYGSLGSDYKRRLLALEGVPLGAL